MSEWRPINTAPTDKMVLLWDDDTGHPEVGRWNSAVEAWLIGYPDGDATWDDPGNTIYGPTHWMPLPDPPQITT